MKKINNHNKLKLIYFISFGEIKITKNNCTRILWLKITHRQKSVKSKCIKKKHKTPVSEIFLNSDPGLPSGEGHISWSPLDRFFSP